MFIQQKLLPMLFCIAITCGLNAQSNLKKANHYASQNAPFLSIKYLQKHIHKHQKDKTAMLLLAQTYLQVNMHQQAKKWLLKAHDAPNAFALHQQIAASEGNLTKDLQPKSINVTKQQNRHLFEQEGLEIFVQKEKERTDLMAAVFEVVAVVL